MEMTTFDVTIAIPDRVYFGLRSDREVIDPRLQWCRENNRHPISHYGPWDREDDRQETLFTFRFERQEDAALFKLFWC